MRAALKLIMIATGLLLMGLAVGAVLLASPLERVVRYQVEQKIGRLYQTRVTLSKIELAPRELAVVLVDLAIHNPPAFDAGEAIHCSRVVLTPALATLLSPAPELEEVRVDGLLVNLRHEAGDGTNLGQLVRAAKSRAVSNEAAGKEQAAPAPALGQRRVKIDRFSSSGGRITLSSTLVPVSSASLDLAEFSEDLQDQAGLPAQAAYVLLRSLLVRTLTVNGLVQPLVEKIQEEML